MDVLNSNLKLWFIDDMNFFSFGFLIFPAAFFWMMFNNFPFLLDLCSEFMIGSASSGLISMTLSVSLSL